MCLFRISLVRVSSPSDEHEGDRASILVRSASRPPGARRRENNQPKLLGCYGDSFDPITVRSTYAE